MFNELIECEMVGNDEKLGRKLAEDLVLDHRTAHAAHNLRPESFRFEQHETNPSKFFPRFVI